MTQGGIKMGKALIVFATRSGGTKKLAELIAEGFKFIQSIFSATFLVKKSQNASRNGAFCTVAIKRYL
jgi:flavodoxin